MVYGKNCQSRRTCAGKTRINYMPTEKQWNEIKNKKQAEITAGLSMNKAVDIAIAEKNITEENIEKWRNWIFQSQEEFMSNILMEEKLEKIEPITQEDTLEREKQEDLEREDGGRFGEVE
jgi:hypothetical protein